MSSKWLLQVSRKTSTWSSSPAKPLRRLKSTRTAFIALGSNDGNTIENIENACHHLDRCGLQVLRTSRLYETDPMYYHDQAKFINGACEVKVQDNVSPLDLLAKLKEIEELLGRKKVIEKGPRNIDLDILLYGDQIWKSDTLSIPHKSMLEREFVLRPLCDLIPDASHPPANSQTYRDHLRTFQAESITSTVTAFGNDGVLKPLDPSRETAIMSILNVTPDSFSDGGLYQDPGLSLPIIRDHIKNGASIIDIGGYSTRPGAVDITVEEELSRVIPMIQAVTKFRNDNAHLKISIDTFRHEVAEEAIKNGAGIVNDVSAGLEDSKMLSTVARLGCTYIAMHMRGNPQTMTKCNTYQHGIIHGVATELLARVEAAENAGIRKWRIVLDPGIGFAKNQSQNLELLRDFDKLRRWPGLEGFAWLIGASRKSFIGSITKIETAKDRIWGTAAAVAASVQAGADIVRVHDVKEMSQVVRFADALWRHKSG